MTHKNRIWELDALRGVCILGMLVFHLLYDITDLFYLLPWQLPRWAAWIASVGAALFLLLSGLCVTLGSRPVRRGLTVFGCGMACTLVTWILALLELSSNALIIRFGMLHCLGLSMLLWPMLKSLPVWTLTCLGVAALIVGGYIEAIDLHIASRWLFPLGLPYPGFSSGDYYPMLPYFGWFVLGAVAGRSLYKAKQTLFPRIDPGFPLIAFARFCGRHSLVIYLAHQPVFIGLLTLLTLKDGSL